MTFYQTIPKLYIFRLFHVIIKKYPHVQPSAREQKGQLPSNFPVLLAFIYKILIARESMLARDYHRSKARGLHRSRRGAGCQTMPFVQLDPDSIQSRKSYRNTCQKATLKNSIVNLKKSDIPSKFGRIFRRIFGTRQIQNPRLKGRGGLLLTPDAVCWDGKLSGRQKRKTKEQGTRSTDPRRKRVSKRNKRERIIKKGVHKENCTKMSFSVLHACTLEIEQVNLISHSYL